MSRLVDLDVHTHQERTAPRLVLMPDQRVGGTLLQGPRIFPHLKIEVQARIGCQSSGRLQEDA